MGTERIPFIFNCLNRFRQLYSAEPYAWLTSYMPNYGMQGGSSVRPMLPEIVVLSASIVTRTKPLARRTLP